MGRARLGAAKVCTAFRGIPAGNCLLPVLLQTPAHEVLEHALGRAHQIAGLAFRGGVDGIGFKPGKPGQHLGFQTFKVREMDLIGDCHSSSHSAKALREKSESITPVSQSVSRPLRHPT
jgi:hypothetical protein